MRVPDGYTKYTGERDKRWYDILLKDGRYLHDCWPNADTWHPSNGKRVNDDEVFAIKKVDDPFMRQPNPVTNIREKDHEAKRKAL